MAMQLASMVHGSVREREAPQHPQHVFYQQAQPRSYSALGPAPSPYSTQPSRPEYRYQQQRPQSPPSPPAEEQKPSLPSISNLLAFAGGEKNSSETGTVHHGYLAPIASLTSSLATHSPLSQQRLSTSPQIRQTQHRDAATMQQPSQPQVSRPERLTPFPSVSAPGNHGMSMPPTPPMHTEAVHDGHRSPSAASNHSAASAPVFVGGSLNNMEPHHQRQSVSSLPSLKRDSLPSHSMSPYSASVYGQSPYASSPGAASATSYYSPEQQSHNSAAMYAQRPLPATYQPQTMPLPVPPPNLAANGSNPWQHHHYISASSQSQFQQSQDRYICSTCNKAFSRPSSLRIHSHSHTGEKPYKCPQPGCGKAFSVRSNMKRHERGCHAASSGTSI